MSNLKLEEDVSIVLCGEAGQGIQTVESIMVKAIKAGDYHVFSTKEYMSRVRGGQNSTQIRASSKRVRSYVDRIDILVALSEESVKHLENRISSETVIICDDNILKELDSSKYNLIKIPFLEKARELGGPIYSNVIAAGALSCLLGIEKEAFDECINAMFAQKGEKILDNDLKAGSAGYVMGQSILDSKKIYIDISKALQTRDELLINGTEAVGLGCISGGCRFMSSYPMTPSSPLQVFIAENAHDFDMIFEQAEDEIAAINMGLGASYAGARSIVATSGSGFALMSEAVGLSGMIETPIVIYLAQRPGPAVGLPTRTAQEDLDLALYSSPGEFPRIIYAPGNFEDALEVGHWAFNMADKYQIPVFILTDQYFADIYYNVPSMDVDNLEVEDYLVESFPEYLRYALTENGISPRTVPGHGTGLAIVDSDEHTEEGHITENLDIRTAMVEKRMHKMDKILEDAFKPELFYNGAPNLKKEQNFKLLVIGWGSTYWSIREAVEKLGNKDVAFLHFKQVYPLHPETEKMLEMAEKTVLLENNAKGQLANLIKMETGFKVGKKALKFNGMPFSVEEVVEIIKYQLGEV
ncbi:MAG: 2-oxoacid:acceptor oxidoreductase subunit alpha [Methanobacteriaceae archaeon]|nr:2-oxoacid:acceptor oxidoreductase subunit alpha [Methanobacteriaceae archaeon]MDP2835719.1 2-oxoacid:acceptor oxidoreductase subunit alpha [Methanobacteriaceae archaeon]MDP3033752.1 2-oxoacid:acceptor oxidoreductase subunit alpha [Methanobacteriaceae archaeon]MDP3484022.1 2-oxoacid:acceptor oxidoreductase subunit alpha [Methanobacteriaceae archaeon]MDP3624534.1 2-oxoacid:acceptor oxidoreductase subunit alpha [Methanobacteriaceae archaeon]